TCWTARTTALLAVYWTEVATSQQQVALASLERSIAAARRNQDNWGEGGAHEAIGDIWHSSGEVDAAMRGYQRALEVYCKGGYPLDEARMHRQMGDIWSTQTNLKM